MYKSLLSISILGFASCFYGEGEGRCPPIPPATCYPAECTPCYCLGPDNFAGNAPVCPKTCNGDFIITFAGFYWNAHEDGLEYAIDNAVDNPVVGTGLPTTPQIQALNNLIDAKIKTPNFQWDFGFKLGLGYCTTCDGWDIGIEWTWYHGKANDHVEAEINDNHTLLPIFSAFSPAIGFVLFSTDIESFWKLELNLIDIELGRDFWTSKYLSIRPHLGLRIAYIKQDFDLHQKGGSWSPLEGIINQGAFNDEVDIENDFKGVGIRTGLNSTWNFGCGWALYGNFAASIVYGRFDIEYCEEIILATSPFSNTKIGEWENHFRTSRGIFDLALGIQWSTMFCNCSYGFTGMIGWENHLFFDQNQLWSYMRIGDGLENQLPNNTGENVYTPRRGNLDTQGWTLRIKLEF